MADRLLLSILAICLLQVSQVTCQKVLAENTAAKQTESKTTTSSPKPAESKTASKPAEAKSSEAKPADAKSSAAKTSEPAKTSSGLPKVMDMGATWCAPCKIFGPIFDKVAENYKGKVDFVHYDVESDAGKPVAEKYKVDSLPTVIFLDRKGKLLLKKEQKLSEAELVKFTDNLLK